MVNVKIRCIDGYYDVGGGKQFTNLDDFLDHYKEESLVETSGRVIRLEFVSQNFCDAISPKHRNGRHDNSISITRT